MISGSTKEFIFAIISAFLPSSAFFISLLIRKMNLSLSENGDTKTFIVTRIDDTSLTVDANHPLCGRDVIFKLEILSVRDATKEEIEIGGPTGEKPDIEKSLLLPL